MRKQEKSSISLRAGRLSTILLLLLTSNFGFGQQGEIVMLSKKVGTELDAEEKEILGLFTDIEGFQSAQFYELSKNRYLAKVVYLDRTHPRTMKRYYSWNEFVRMRSIVDRHPEITDEMRAEHRYKLSYLRVRETMEAIAPSTYCVIRHQSGRKLTGTFIEYRDRTILFQAPTKRLQIPVSEIESISYRPFVDEGNLKKKALTFLCSGLVGLGLGELWNFQSRPSIDMTWHNRFTGAILGLVTGSELFEAVSMLTSPRKFVAFSAEEVKRLKQ